MSDRRPALLAAAVMVVVWASAFAGIRYALEEYGPMHVAFGRMLVASIAFAVAAPLGGINRPARPDLWRLAVGGLLGMTAYHGLLNLGEEEVTAATAALLIATMPLFTMLLAMGRLGEHVGRRQWAGTALALLGVLVVTFEGDGAVRFEPAALLVLLAAISAAGYTVVQKPVLARVRPVAATAWATWFATLLLVPWARGFPAAVAEAPISSTLALVWLGVMPSALGYALYTFVLARFDASVTVVFLYLIPPVAALIAWIWLGETVGALTAVGGAVALVGVGLATGTARRTRPATASEGLA